jgi:L-alanine-DL-glutamate epimerase-like enolase superfamily enzyme
VAAASSTWNGFDCGGRTEIAKVGRPAAVALSAIEQTLWDLQGQALGVPPYQLFGGLLRARRIPSKVPARVAAWAGEPRCGLALVRGSAEHRDQRVRVR